MTQEILSAGIDIGTSTTHLSLSRLRIQNVSAGTRVPRLSITEREVIYQSEIYRTPLQENRCIDAQAVAKIIDSEYAKAGFRAVEIKTGALIITGESAMQRNAQELSNAMAHLAGDFVVASAGPHLESLLAGRGSGAEHASRAQRKTICNIDIGGGTCNYAVFKNGVFIDSACLGIGGRCIQFDENGQINRFTESGETFLDGVAKLRMLPLGTSPAGDLLELIASLISELVLHVATRAVPPQIVQRLMHTDALRLDYEIDEFWISGGVADCMRDSSSSESGSAAHKYGDMGWLIARALPAAFAERNLKFRIAEQTIRATVIGAGMHSMQLSGSTIWVNKSRLPLRNVQIVKPFQSTDSELNGEEIKKKLNHALDNFRLDESASNFAIEVCDLSKLSYKSLQIWAAVLADFFAAGGKTLKTTASRGTGGDAQPLILISREDIGMALGQTIHKNSPEIELIILDGVDTTYGDYLDIGSPLANQEAVPLTVKTLVFRQA